MTLPKPPGKPRKNWVTESKWLKLINFYDEVLRAKKKFNFNEIVAYREHMEGFGKGSRYSRSGMEYDKDDKYTLREYKLDDGSTIFSVQYYDLGPDGYGYDPSDKFFLNYNQAVAEFKKKTSPGTVHHASSNRKASQVLADLERRIARLERNL